MSLIIRTTNHNFGDGVLQFHSDHIGGETLDTRVAINGTTLCWITGDSILDFVGELKAVIDKYRI
jgi:hypothetical protein